MYSLYTAKRAGNYEWSFIRQYFMIFICFHVHLYCQTVWGVGNEASYGYFWMWFSFVFETIAGALHWWMPLNDELTEVPTVHHPMFPSSVR